MRCAEMTWVKKLLKWIDAIQGADEQMIKQQLKMWVEEYTVDASINPSAKIIPEVTTIH